MSLIVAFAMKRTDVFKSHLLGDDEKHCECEVIVGSSFHKALNPMWLPMDSSQEEASPLVASCDLWEADKELGHWGEQQWKAVEAFCSKAW